MQPLVVGGELELAHTIDIRVGLQPESATQGIKVLDLFNQYCRFGCD
jgi:hypothetical protein